MMDPRDDGDVADSTDWLSTTLACLMPVEQALRCHVCKDFYNSPMITSCNHTFCSLCIRRCLSVDGKCPLCRMTDQESKLRGNWALREAIDAFCRARPAVLEVARKPPPPSPPPRATTLPASKRKADGEEGGARPKRTGQDEPQAKRTRMSARLSKTKAAEAVASMAAQEEVEESVEDPIQTSGSSRGGDGDDMDYEPDDGLVACPICQRRMKLALINSHLDTSCSGSPQRPKPTTTAHAGLSKPAYSSTSIWNRDPSVSSSSSTFNPFSTSYAQPQPQPPLPLPPPDRLPSVSYSLLNDGALRKKMAALGLATFGARQLLERRHKEWTTIWNANCDSARPKRKADLLHDLDIWERTVGAGGNGGGGGGGGMSSGGGGSMMGSRGGAAATLTSRSIVAANQQAALIKDKDFDGAAWSAKHSTSFQDLIANARKSRLKQQGVATTKDTDEGAAADEGQAQGPKGPQGPKADGTDGSAAGDGLQQEPLDAPAALDLGIAEKATTQPPPLSAETNKENDEQKGKQAGMERELPELEPEAPRAGGSVRDRVVIELQ